MTPPRTPDDWYAAGLKHSAAIRTDEHTWEASMSTFCCAVGDILQALAGISHANDCILEQLEDSESRQR